MLKAISLFSGAGGCSLGFAKCGVDIIAAYDNNQSAIDTYNLNFGGNKCFNVDLAKCDFDEIRMDLGLERGQLDLIIGGPPCQGFTTAGNRSVEDVRNKLVGNYARALELIFPRWFVMENVEGILTTAGGSYLVEFLNNMIRLGYSVSLEKIYAHEYGVPQRRKRVFIVGNREGKSFSFPQRLSNAYGAIYRNGVHTLWDAIGDLENSDLPELDHTQKKEVGIRLERIRALKVGQTMKDLPQELQHTSFKRRANRRVCDGTPSEKRGGAPSGLKRLSYDEPALTITSSSISEFVHPTKDRMLTLRECARIQTFPDTFMFTGTDQQKAMQIGNAIPPLLAYYIAKQIAICDNGEKFYVPVGLLAYCVTKADAMSPLLQRTCSMLEDLLVKKCEQMRLTYAN
ncbi:MAG: DNA cytosine methyltransferase [Clostridiales bacterium]|nr:DNA cytosine methyltransferase [Clostridiales bacterium]